MGGGNWLDGWRIPPISKGDTVPSWDWTADTGIRVPLPGGFKAGGGGANIAVPKGAHLTDGNGPPLIVFDTNNPEETEMKPVKQYRVVGQPEKKVVLDTGVVNKYDSYSYRLPGGSYWHKTWVEKLVEEGILEIDEISNEELADKFFTNIDNRVADIIGEWPDELGKVLNAQPNDNLRNALLEFVEGTES